MQGRARRLAIRATVSVAAAVIVVPAAHATAAARASFAPTGLQPIVSHATAFAISPPLRRLAPAPVTTPALPSLPRMLVANPLAPTTNTGTVDPVVQSRLGPDAAPAVGVSFDGISARPDLQLVPPDTNGEVGPNDFVEIINLQMAVYSKSGHLRFGPVTLDQIFGPLGAQCGVSGVGDPVVVYDQMADRWLLSQFGFLFDPLTGDPTGPYYECIAVSKTADPAGQYYLYAFKTSDTVLNDYPKIGVWPDAYYLSINQFAQPNFDFAGASLVAFDRAAMIAGNPNASMISFDLYQRDPNYAGLLPADLDGHRLPPVGTPEIFAQVSDPTEEVLPDTHEGGGEGGDEHRQVHRVLVDSIQLFRFHVDFGDPSRSRVDGPFDLPTAPFDENMCNFDFECIPQKGTFSKVDALSDRLMFRAAYRNFGDHQSLVLNHTVDVGNDHAGVRWYEIRNPAGTPTVYQQGTFAPDDDDRWMGSVAMDANGDIGLGYSISGSNLYPSVRFTARRASDPLGQMTLGEGSLVEGAGAQTAAGLFARWGDYSDMTVDPVDDCTFWYTQEYYRATSELGFATRIGSFEIPGCDGIAPTVTAHNARVKAGKVVKLAYTTSDNSGKTSEEITVFSPRGKKLRTIDTPVHAAGAGSVTFRAPRAAGIYSWEVVASDAKHNESDPSTARLRVT